jgi:hypothetical protein
MVGSFARQRIFTDGNPGPIPTASSIILQITKGETIIDSSSRKRIFTDGNPGPTPLSS